MPRVFVYIGVVVLMLLCGAHAQDAAPEVQQAQPMDGVARKNETGEVNVQEELFRKAFRKRRKEHHEAVKTLQKMESYERLYKMIMVLAEKVVEVIESSRALIENAGFNPGNTTFPQDASVRDALSTILENAALFGDIILHVPYITHRILKAQQAWNATIHWSLNFANQTRHFLDPGTVTMIHLVGQELNITKRDSGYHNPYWTQPSSGNAGDAEKKKKMQKKEKRKKGPQMIKIEL